MKYIHLYPNRFSCTVIALIQTKYHKIISNVHCSEFFSTYIAIKSHQRFPYEVAIYTFFLFDHCSLQIQQRDDGQH